MESTLRNGESVVDIEDKSSVGGGVRDAYRGEVEKKALLILTVASKYGFKRLMRKYKLDALVTPLSKVLGAQNWRISRINVKEVTMKVGHLMGFVLED
ncbi:hypothetical protein LOK49_LG02G03851 [Camellia lanceoleosa]|uniref:Uncharacterized protein n=1 Tax=Camellia lanceoleosa TaxID=1840588 RepID=A0ACC0INM4_9ERIC|nr:hypothetical protein LOK49_LG02G03851 [Camellia lanceoleosa]